METKSFEQCVEMVAKKYKFDSFDQLIECCIHCTINDEDKNPSDFTKEAAQLWRDEGIKEAVKLAREKEDKPYYGEMVLVEKYTEQEILEKLNLKEK